MRIFYATITLLAFCSYADAMFIFRGSGGGTPEATCVGTAYYVSATGSDAADGLSVDTPWQTITKVNGAAATLVPSDCVFFKRGDTWGSTLMPETQGLLIPDSGTAGNPITFGAYGTGDKPVFDGTGVNLPQNHGLIRGDSKSYITFQDIRVQDSGIGDADENPGIGFYAGTNLIVQRCEVANTESSGIKLNTSSSVSVLNNNVTMTNCEDASEQISLSAVNGFEVAYNESYTNCDPSFSPPGGAGIDSKQGSKNGSIHHNNVYDIAGGSNGIYVDAYDQDTSNIEVYNNRVHNISGAAGIQIGAELGGALHDILVHHNIVSLASNGGINLHNAGPTGSPVYDIKIFNNTVYQNGTNGTNYLGGARIFDQMLEPTSGYPGVTFKNNIFANGYYFQIGFDPPVEADDIVMDYNVIYGTHADSGGFTAITETTHPNSHPITIDPLFTNAAGGDFTLQAGSSALNVCDNSVWQGTANVVDYNGVAITDGSGNIVAPGGTVNCGAFE